MKRQDNNPITGKIHTSQSQLLIIAEIAEFSAQETASTVTKHAGSPTSLSTTFAHAALTLGHRLVWRIVVSYLCGIIGWLLLALIMAISAYKRLVI